MSAIKIVLLVFSILCYSNVFSRTAEDGALNSSLVKLTPTAALGQCLPQSNPTNVTEILRRNNIEVLTGSLPKERGPASSLVPLTDVTDERMIAVARILAAYEGLGNGSMDALRSGEKISIIFDNGNSDCSNSRRFESQIQLCPGNQNRQGMNGNTEHGGVDNMALIAHEIAHYVGGCQGGKRYEEYNKYMAGGQCKITSYAAKNPQEEFAEVMAAYITMPQAFKDKGKNCETAFKFMRALFGENTELNLSQSESELCRIRQASYQPGVPALTRTAELDLGPRRPSTLQNRGTNNSDIHSASGGAL